MTSEPRPVVVVRTGIANLASVLAGLKRSGLEPTVSSRPRDIESAERLVLPGVGAFGAAMASIVNSSLTEPLRDYALSNRPMLAICLGMQLLFERSEESPGVPGLAIAKGEATRFGPASRSAAPTLRVPQLGWNHVTPDPHCKLIEPGCAYFANSFRITEPPPGFATARTDYGGRFISAIERGNLVACQFHPELSGTWGLALLKRWATSTAEVNAC